MPREERREAITDAQIGRRGLSTRSLRTVQMGTHAMGAAWGGTVSFTPTFQGTPFVLLQPMQGSSAFNRNVNLRVNTRASNQFTYMGSPNHGTFSWVAMGTFVPTA